MNIKTEKDFNIITFGKRLENFELALNNKLIGSSLSTVNQHIKNGNIILLHWKGYIWGFAEIKSDYFFSDELIWKDKIYPHRFKIEDISITTEPIHLSNGIYNTELKKMYGTGWAYKFIFSPKPLPKNIGLDIYNKLKNLQHVDLESFSLKSLQDIFLSLK